MHGCGTFTTVSPVSWLKRIFHTRKPTGVKNGKNDGRTDALDIRRTRGDAENPSQPHNRPDGSLCGDLCFDASGRQTPVGSAGREIPVVLTSGRAVSEGRPEGHAPILNRFGRDRKPPLIVLGPGGGFFRSIQAQPYFAWDEKIYAAIILTAMGLAAVVAITSNQPSAVSEEPSSRSEQPAQRGRGGGSTPYPAPASFSQSAIEKIAPGPGTGEVSPRFARRRQSPPAIRTDFQFSIFNCPLLKEQNFFAAIRTEESYDGKVTIGDGGLSRGDYHITRAFWTDGCEQGNVDWDYDTLVWSRPHCEQIMLWYFQRYCPDAMKRCDLKTLARIHNGGPRGHRKAATLEYWRRIQKHMAKGEPVNQ